MPSKAGRYPMLTVTENAKAHLHDLISQNSIGDEQAIRLVPRKNGLGCPRTPRNPATRSTTTTGGRSWSLISAWLSNWPTALSM